MMDSANNCAYCGFSLNSKAESKYPQALPYGSILHGKYITGRVLGQGGFGITYVAQDYNTKELVAIKEYFPGAMATRTGTRSVQAYNVANSDSFSFGKRIFLKEATTLSRFSGNPNIVKVRSFFEENGTAYFAMEYVKGESLKSYVRKRGGSISWQEAERILLPVMEALEAVHAQGIIHRDISPDNIALADNGQVKLLDFGAARYSMGERSQSLSVILKHGYAPAEQYSRHGHQGPWTDVYAMAATFYNVLTGEMVPDSIDRTHSDTLVLPSRLGVIVPEHVEAALAKALSVRQEDRFQSMADFKDALTRKVILPKTVVTDPIVTEVPPPAGPKGLSGKLIGLAAAAVILLICGILFIFPLPSPDAGAGNTEEGITSGNFLNKGFFAMSEKDCYAYSGSKLYYCKDSDLSAAELVGDGRAGEFLNIVDNHIYFLSQYEHAIYRMDPDGNNKVKVYDASSDTGNEPTNLYIYHGWFYFSNHNKLFRGSLKDLDDLEKGPLTKAECIATDFNYENKVLASLCFIEDCIYYDGEKGLSSMELDGSGKKTVCDKDGKFITDGQAIYCLNGLYRVSRILPDGSVTQIIDLKDVGKIREINYADGWIYYLLEVDDGKYLCRAGTDGSGNVAIDFVTESKNTVVSMNTFAGSEYAFFYILEKDGENLTPVSKSVDIPKETSASAAPQTGADSNAKGKAEEGTASSDTNAPSEENAIAYAKAYMDLFCGRDADLKVPFSKLNKKEIDSVCYSSVDEMISEMHTDPPPSDSYRKHIHEFYEKAFSKAKYTIGEASKTEDGNKGYDISITITPVRIFYGQSERIKELTDSGVLTDMTDEEKTAAIENSVYNMEYLDNPEYADPATYTLHYRLLDEKSGTYGFDGGTEQSFRYWLVNMQ